MTGVGFCSARKRLQNRQTVGAGKNDVEQDEVGRFFVKQVEAFLGVGGLDDLVRRFEHSL